MKIETKFDIGDTVLFFEVNSELCLEIKVATIDSIAWVNPLCYTVEGWGGGGKRVLESNMYALELDADFSIALGNALKALKDVRFKPHEFLQLNKIKNDMATISEAERCRILELNEG